MCAEVERGIVLLVDGRANRGKEEEQMNYQMYFDSHPCSKQHREEAPKETQKLTTMTFSRAHVNTEAAKEEG
jgi:hypothetical protein